MIKFTRCPKCQTLYELEGVNFAESGGWVQCGECDRKFKATRYAVELDELSFTVSNYALDDSMKVEGAVEEDLVEASMQIIENTTTDTKDEAKTEVKKEDIPVAEVLKPEDKLTQKDELINETHVPIEPLSEQPLNVNIAENSDDEIISFLSSQDQEFRLPNFSAQEALNKRSQGIEKQQLSLQTQASDSEFLEKTIILPEEITDGGDYDDILDDFNDDIFSPELIDEDQDEQKTPKKRSKNAYAQMHSEFSEEEIIVQSSFSEKSLLEEELETSKRSADSESISNFEDGFKTINIEPNVLFFKVLPTIACFMLMVGVIGLFALQLHTRGTLQWIPQKNYEGLLSQAPLLTKLEKTQTDLSAIHLSSTKMELVPEKPEARVISLQLVNRSFQNQAYPDVQLEFTDAQGDVIARRVIFPSLYLDQDHFGFLESRQAKTVFLNLASVPDDTVGYGVKVVQQNN